MINFKSEIAGLFKFEAFQTDKNGDEIAGTRRVLADWFPNLITDNGLNLIGSASNWLQHCQVGSGSTPANVLQTGLVSRIASTTTVQTTLSGAQSSAPYFTWRRNTYRFAEGTATGNIAEVGVGAAATGNLFSRALVIDGSGNPVTIQVLANESLDVSYEVRYFAPTVDGSADLVINGTTHSIVSRAANVTQVSGSGWTIGGSGQAATLGFAGAFNGAIAAITASPTGTLAASDTRTDDSYSAGSYRRDGTATWGLNSGNLAGGISALRVTHGVGTYQFGVTPPIPKTASTILTLKFRHSWARRP